MRRRPAAIPALAVVLLLLLAVPAVAQEGIFSGLQTGLELTASSASTTTTFATGLTTRTKTESLFPSLTLNVDALVYPALRLNAGGVFEVNMLSTNINGGKIDSTIGRNRPYFLLRSTNPVLSPGFGYFRREDRARTNGLSEVKLVNDEYDGYLGWNPAGGPHSEFQFVRTHTFDDTRALQDTRRDFGTLVSNYSYRNLGAYYRGAYLKSNDEVVGIETRQVTHAARVSDSGAVLRKRLVWDATYNINYQDLTSAASGSAAEVAVPVTPFAGLSSLSDTPTISRLSQNALLIDGNLTVGAGINLGLVTPPADAQARNIGLDFLNPTEVNRLLVWVDRDLPVDVAGSFSWEIYSSIDNVTWRRETVASSASFDPFEHRFELVFPGIAARYLKVVTRPLAMTVPEASRYVDILVTELQAFVRRPAGKTDRITQTTHLVNTDVRMRILDAPSLFYEGFFLYNGPSAFGTSTTTLSNGVSVNHAFGRIFSAYARGALEQGDEPRGDRVATITNATLTIDPIPTFRSSLLYTGQDERIADVPNDRHGFFLQNTAQIYRGVDVVFGIGWNRSHRETGEIANDRLVNLTATVVPRQRVSLTFTYDDTTTDHSGTYVGRPRTHVQRVYGALAVDPVRTLHLVVGEEVIVMTGENTRTTVDIGANWAPFPDGTLQIMFAHNEALRAVEFGKDRSTLGVVRWNLSRKSYVDVSYQRTRSEFVVQTTETRLFSIRLRLFV